MINCHVDKAITYFSQMMKHGVPPNLNTYAEMVLLFLIIASILFFIINVLRYMG